MLAFDDESGPATGYSELREAGGHCVRCTHQSVAAAAHVPPLVTSYNQSSRAAVKGRMRDVRYAFRLIRRQPMFAALVIATLTLGIGASTSMFSVVNGVLLKPLPYRDPDRLVWMYGSFRGSDSAAVSPADFVDYRNRNEVFERLAAMAISPGSVTVSGSGAPVRMRASRVSAELISLLGTVPALGRDFSRADETAGSDAIIVSHRFWQERFEGAADVVGRSIVVEGRPYTVAGVMPAGFTLPYDNFIRLTEPVDLFLPLALDDAEAQIRRFHSLRLIGRLKAGGGLPQAQSQMDVVARQLEATYPENETWRLRLVPLGERIVGGVRPVLQILMAAVTLLLLVSCANVASLLLARASARESELALRGALGATRGSIVRQLLIEGLSLSIMGAAGGLILTRWTVEALRQIGPAQFPRLEGISLDPAVVLFALASAGVTTVIFALAPAVHAARGDVAAAIRPSRAVTQDRQRRLGQRALVIAQLSVSVALLSGAALLVRGFLRLVAIDPGFTASDVTLTPLPLPDDRYDADASIDGFYGALLERLTASPGIEAVSLATAPPLAGANDTVVYREGRPPATASDRRFAQIRRIQGQYFGALRIPIVAGRTFDDRADRAGARDVAIVSRRMAREHLGSDDAVGQRVVVDLGEPIIAEVIGVAGDVRIFGRANDAPPMVYLHARQHPATFMQAIVKAAMPPGEVASTIRRHLQTLDPVLAPGRTERMEALLADSVAQPRFAMLLIGSFAGLALTLTLVGLYGTLAYLVSQRQREFGIRLAMGATRGCIRRMVFRQGLALIACGVPAGIVLSLFTSRFAAAFLLNVQGSDPMVLAGVAALLTVTSLAAMLGPAQRAAGVEPLAALRAD
jgi:putative ABC transport system permease protein